jgi:cob(I)alamin adenosyltransferase
MKIYTRTGDEGLTGLFGGERVSKSSERIELIGAIDELNAALGMAVSSSQDDEIKRILHRIQGELFVAGAQIASPPREVQNGENKATVIPNISDEMITKLENEIDSFTAEAGELSNFIFPGGSVTGSAIHFARCVCRRVERVFVRASTEIEIPKLV